MKLFNIFKKHTETHEENHESGLEKFNGEIFEIELSEIPTEIPAL